MEYPLSQKKKGGKKGKGFNLHKVFNCRDVVQEKRMDALCRGPLHLIQGGGGGGGENFPCNFIFLYGNSESELKVSITHEWLGKQATETAQPMPPLSFIVGFLSTPHTQLTIQEKDYKMGHCHRWVPQFGWCGHPHLLRRRGT